MPVVKHRLNALTAEIRRDFVPHFVPSIISRSVTASRQGEFNGPDIARAILPARSHRRNGEKDGTTRLSLRRHGVAARRKATLYYMFMDDVVNGFVSADTRRTNGTATCNMIGRKP